ncbi:MAG TPA: HisA/HisF-related TIM barrel protein [Gammaproteobacteria bacterium]|nr:HisA/HisF-related TIM barrel protein [Gammaproteobacteria bacterium]
MQSRNFRLQRVGDINWLEKHYHFQKISFFIDELIVLNASRETKSIDDFSKMVSRLTKNIFIPIAAGGGIRTVEDAEILFNNGADKIVLNSSIYQDTHLVEELVNNYGSQSIIASIDYKNINGVKDVFIFDGTTKIDLTLGNYIIYVENLNIGEIYLNSIDKDGTGFGYDFETINDLKNNLKVPLIIAGGAGNERHLLEGLNTCQVSAVATANLFNFLGNSLPIARNKIINAGVNIAPWEFSSGV